MKKTIIFYLAILTLFSCKNSSQDSSSTQPAKSFEASVRLNWIASCSFVGEIAGMKEFAEKDKLKLKVETGGPGLDPIKMVQSGTNTFGVAGADLVLAANDKGADLVVIGLVSYNSPGVWLAKKEKNINTIADVKGKRIGELPGGNMQYLYEVFLKRTNLERNKDFKPVPIPFELKNFIAQDECDLRPVFIYDETSELELNNIQFTLLEPKDYGIQFKGMCYFTKRSTIEKSPVMVQSFINSMARGWEFAISNPEKAIQYLKEFDNTIRYDKELLGFRRGADYFKGYEGKLLYTDIESWKAMAQDMKDLGFISKEPDWGKTLNLSFVENYHGLNK